VGFITGFGQVSGCSTRTLLQIEWNSAAVVEKHLLPRPPSQFSCCHAQLAKSFPEKPAKVLESKKEKAFEQHLG
jgi:hypothetical protein